MAATAANVSYIYEINGGGGGGGGGTQNGGNGVAVASSAPPNSAPMHNGVMQVGDRVDYGEGQRLAIPMQPLPSLEICPFIYIIKGAARQCASAQYTCVGFSLVSCT